MSKIQLTQEGIDGLKRELETAQTVTRPAVVEKLQKARSMGDLKENNAYQSAREELGDLDGRILEIQHILKNAQAVTKNNDGTVQLGSIVEVEVDGQKRSFSIVGEHESDPMNGKLSYTSPIGAGLMGTKAGMSVTIQLPAGIKMYKVISIK
jgi:transcription elongation factor GreA